MSEGGQMAVQVMDEGCAWWSSEKRPYRRALSESMIFFRAPNEPGEVVEGETAICVGQADPGWHLVVFSPSGDMRIERNVKIGVSAEDMNGAYCIPSHTPHRVIHHSDAIYSTRDGLKSRVEKLELRLADLEQKAILWQDGEPTNPPQWLKDKAAREEVAPTTPPYLPGDDPDMNAPTVPEDAEGL